ncbi:unnamed protein product [Effrenium voratum]|nr:unnamed protein product [Effrenium voratum]CAJ1420257.1 unnamed protein product [Effrenium voratum]
MDMRPPPPPPGLSLAQQAQQLQSAKFGGVGVAPKLPINMGPGPGGPGGPGWQGGMQGGGGMGSMTQPGMSNGMQGSGMQGGMRPSWGGAQQFGQGQGGMPNYSQPMPPGQYTPQQYVGRPGGNSPGGLQRTNSYGNSGGYGPGGGPGGPGGPQVVPPPPGGPAPLSNLSGPPGPPPGPPPMQYGQFGLPSARGQRGGPHGPHARPPPHPNWKPGQPPPPPGPGPPVRVPGSTLEAALAAAQHLGAGGMLEATSAIDFSAKLEDLRRKHPQVKVPSDAWTWKPEELEAWFASGGTSKVPLATSAAAKEAPAPKEAATPKKRSHGEAFGFEIQEALQLQQQLLTAFSEAEFQENLKSLQAQYPERKTKGHYDSLAFFEAFNSLALTVYTKVLPDWKLQANWDGVREMLSKMQDALTHPKVKKVQEEINVTMGLPRNAIFAPPSKCSELFIFRPDGDGPVPGYALPLFQDEDGDEAHEFLVEDEETGELKVRGASSLEQEMWYQVNHKPAVMIREQPDEKAKMVGRKKAGKRLRIQSVKDGKWLQLHQSELVKLGVQEAWVVLDPVEAGLPAGAPLLEKVAA